jgi:hypothetical protein
MAAFNKVLEFKLRIIPRTKQRAAKLVSSTLNHVDERVLLQLKSAEDLEHEKLLRELKLKKKLFHETPQCKFMRRAKSSNVSPTKNIKTKNPLAPTNKWKRDAVMKSSQSLPRLKQRGQPKPSPEAKEGSKNCDSPKKSKERIVYPKLEGMGEWMREA